MKVRLDGIMTALTAPFTAMREFIGSNANGHSLADYIPEMFSGGQSGDIVIRPHHHFASSPAGFHRRYHLDLEIEERTAGLAWDTFGIEVSWAMPQDFFLDPWQLERDSRKPRRSPDGKVQVETRWNCRELKDLIDLEAPTYDPRAKPFELKGTLLVRKDPSFHQTKWETRITIPDLLIRYQSPSAQKTLPELRLKSPKIRLVPSYSINHKVPSLGYSKAGLKPLAIAVPYGTPSGSIALITIICIAACSLILVKRIVALKL
jgi:hypothetical protein